MSTVTFDPQHQSEASSSCTHRNVFGGLSPRTDEKPLSFMYRCSLQIQLTFCVSGFAIQKIYSNNLYQSCITRSFDDCVVQISTLNKAQTVSQG